MKKVYLAVTMAVLGLSLLVAGCSSGPGTGTSAPNGRNPSSTGNIHGSAHMGSGAGMNNGSTMNMNGNTGMNSDGRSMGNMNMHGSQNN